MEPEGVSEDESDEDVRKQYKQPEPKPASSSWAGRFFSPWWWLGGQTRAKEDTTPEEVQDTSDVVDWYHGTEVHKLPRILSEGLRPSVVGLAPTPWRCPLYT